MWPFTQRKAKTKRKAAKSSLRPKASLMHTFLPRCAKCFHPHPEACKPPVLDGKCPNCGTPAKEGPTHYQTTDLELRGFWGRIASALYDFADWLNPQK